MQSEVAHSWGAVARQGALAGAQTALSYVSLFGAYAVVRAVLSVADAAQPSPWAAGAAVGITLAYLFTVWAGLSVVPAAVVGALTGVLVGQSRAYCKVKSGQRTESK